MALIKPRSRGKQFVHVRARLEQQNYETLFAYAAFLGEDVDYVLNEVIDRLLAKDKDFVAWRAAHPQAYASPSAATRRPAPPPHRSHPPRPSATAAPVSA